LALALENVSFGRQLVPCQSRRLVAPEVTSCWPMIAQAPTPMNASATAAHVPRSAPNIASDSERLKFISRSSRDCCVEPSAVSRKEADRPASSGWAAGVP
jgi:hypothetical protein